MTELLLGAGVFLGITLLDFLCALYILAVGNKEAIRSGLFAAAMYTVNALVIIGVVQDNWLVIPACAGSFVGTFLGIKVVK